MSTLTKEEKESALISRLLQTSVDDNLREGFIVLKQLKDELSVQCSRPLLSLTKIDDALIERLSLRDCSDLGGQLLYLYQALDRVETEANKSVLSTDAKEVCVTLQEVLQRYVVTAIKCPELFNLDGRSANESGQVLSRLALTGSLPILAVIKICNLVAGDSDMEFAEDFAAPYLLGVIQRIVTMRSFDVFSEQAVGDVNTLALFLKMAKNNYVPNIIVKTSLFFPPHLPGPMTLPGQQPPAQASTNKNVFVLQTSSLLGRLMMPNTIDHILMPPQEIPTHSAKHLKFRALSRTTVNELRASVAQVRAQLGSVMDSVLSVVQPLLRTDEATRLAVLKWFACAITNSSSRATMGWQQQMAPHGVQLAEHLSSPQASAQIGGSLERFRMIMNMQSVRMKGVVSSGVAMNLAWTIFELCKPIKLQNCGGVDEFFLASNHPIAQELVASLGNEARLGDSDRVRQIREQNQTGPGAFKTQIFWLAVNAIHTLVLPTCKEAETAIQCASVFSRDKKEGPMNDAYGEYLCFEMLLDNPRFMESLAHVINLMLVMVLRCAVNPKVNDQAMASQAPSVPFESLDIRNELSEDQMSDSMAILPACMMEEIVQLLDFYRLTRDAMGASAQQSRDITEMLDPDLFLLFTIWTLGSDKIKNPNIRGKAAHVLIGLVKDPRFGSRIERSPYAVRNIGPACIRVFSAVEKTKQSYYDIRMHIKFELRIPIQRLFELLLNIEEHRAQLRSFVSEFRDDFYKFASQLLNDTTYLLEEGLDTLMAIRKKEAEGVNEEESSSQPAAAASSSGGTAGLGVDRTVEQDDQNEQGQDMYRRSRHDPIEHCKQYMRMGHQTMSTLHQMCRQTCDVIVDDKVVLEQMITSCLDPSLDRLVGPKCLELKSQRSRYDFGQFEFDPKKLLNHIIEMYVYLARGSDRREKVAKILAEDLRYYRPETLRKAITIARREHLISPEMLKEFEDFVKFTNEFATQSKSAMDSVEIPDEFLDPIMAEIMTDPVLLPTSHNIMDRKHIMRIILSDDHDPFNRQPLKPSDLIPQDDLRQRILTFCQTHNIVISDD
jgi:ubiquitin conjugation factor E4 B